MDKEQIFYIASYPEGLHKKTYTKEELLRELRSTLDDNKKSFFVWSPGWSKWITLDQSPSFYSSQNTPPPIPWRACICTAEILSLFVPAAVKILTAAVLSLTAGSDFPADTLGFVAGLVVWIAFVDYIFDRKSGFGNMNFTTFLVLCMSISYPLVLAHCICKRIKNDIPKQLFVAAIIVSFISFAAIYLYTQWF